jgi:hypothetical protein
VIVSERFVSTELLHDNALASMSHVEGFRMEGEGAVSFPLGRMRIESTLDHELGQQANIVFWNPDDFPPDIAVSWDFWPIREPGLCIMFFAARGRAGEDLFDPSLAERSGPYDQYHHGDIDAYHVSYFRRRWETERAFHTCNLRKSYGFHLVAQGADPLPPVQDARPPYRLRLIAYRGQIEFDINNVTTLRWMDDGRTGGPPLGHGKIGFRQMAPMIAEYANLQVHRVKPVAGPGPDVNE